MTLVLFNAHPDGVSLFTDTLATDADADRAPSHFLDKVRIAAHVSMVAVGTGYGPLRDHWFQRLDSIVARDIDDIDAWAPEFLRDSWADIEAENGGPPEMGATIRHFGVSAATGDPRCAYYRYMTYDGNDFKSEHLPIGNGAFGANPAPLGPYEPPKVLADFVGLAEQIKAEQTALPTSERIVIGGDLVCTTITPDGVISSRKVHRFSGYDDDWRTAVERLSP